MTKEQFTHTLREKLKGYPRGEVEDSIQYYTEMIEDRMEDGSSEEAAVASLGSADDVAKAIKKNMPLKSVIKEKVNTYKEKKEANGEATISATTVILLVLLFPFWFPLVILFFALYFGFFVASWAIDLGLFIAGGACVLGAGISVFQIFTSLGSGLLLNTLGALGSALALVGVALLLVVAAISLSKGILKLFAAILRGFKNILIGKKKGE